jgi:hypothetical protein
VHGNRHIVSYAGRLIYVVFAPDIGNKRSETPVELVATIAPSEAQLKRREVMAIADHLASLRFADDLTRTKIEECFPCHGPLFHGPVGMVNDSEWRVRIGKAGTAREIDRVHDHEGLRTSAFRLKPHTRDFAYRPDTGEMQDILPQEQTTLVEVGSAAYENLYPIL